MTDSQRDLITKNHNLIYDYIHKYLNDNIDYWYDILAIAMCKSAIKFDESKGYKFSTYLYRSFENEVRIHYRNLNSSKRIPEDLMMSIDEPIPYTEGGIVFSDVLPSPGDIEDEVLTKQEISEAYDKMSDTGKDVVYFSLLGYKQNEIASMLGIHQPYVSRLLNKFKSLLNK